MKKIRLLAAPLAAAAMLFAGCTVATVNQTPELKGVADVNCLVNTTVDLLEGVSALDKEDGDITPDIVITVIPQVEVTNGYAVFSETGSYELIYEVADSWGKTFRTTAYATVVDREVYRSDVLVNGFSLETGGSVEVKAEGLNGGEYSFLLSGGEIAEDVRLTREYTLVCGAAYTFRYICRSNLSGKIKVAADGGEIAELALAEGDNSLSFTYTPVKTGIADSKTVSIELWLGGIEGELDFSLSGATTERYVEDTGYADKISDFNFYGSYYDRFDGTEGNVGTVDDGRGVYVEITRASSDMWQGGVFINTGLALEAGAKYLISFDTYSENDNPFEVCIQRSQWGPDEFVATLTEPSKNGYNEVEVTITDQTSGTLWLYVQTGAYTNKITLSNLNVKVAESGYKTENYFIGQFSTGHYNGGAGYVNTEYGKVLYTAESFGTDWGNNEIGSPSFALSGAASNYVITFKAKASSPLNCVFAASVSDYWETFAWENFTISTEEKQYSIFCNSMNLEGNYKLIWQFGNTANTVYSNVSVEISEIKICYKSILEN